MIASICLVLIDLLTFFGNPSALQGILVIASLCLVLIDLQTFIRALQGLLVIASLCLVLIDLQTFLAGKCPAGLISYCFPLSSSN